MKKLIIWGAVILGLFLMGQCSVSKYNTMVEMDESVANQWSKVESAYQRRSDLIPNLVNTVKGYADFEKETLTQVIEARAKATSVNINAENLNNQSFQQFQQAQDGLSSALSRLLVTIERYPDLKANQNFLQLQNQLEGTENRIKIERDRFNNAVKDYNTFTRKFPNNLFAGFFDFEHKDFFEAESGAEKAPEVNF